MYKVMVVDDLEIVRLQLKRLKIWGEASGFQIMEEAVNGQEALEKLQENPVDLLITDIRMPIIDGVELLKEAREKELAACVVLISEYTEFEYARQGLILGAFDYLLKPVMVNDISKLLDRAKRYIQTKEEDKKHKKDSEFYSKELYKSLENNNPLETLAASIFSQFLQDEKDPLKCYYLVKGFLEDFYKLIYRNMPWYVRYADICCIIDFINKDLLTPEMIRENYSCCIQKIKSQIDYLYLNSSYGNLINNISVFTLEHVEEGLSLSMLADQFELNKNYLSEVFKKKTGISVLDYITKVKMERAKKILAESEIKSYEIAEKLGYFDAEYFSKVFRKYTGVSATEYRSLQKQKVK
jgi:Response regulator containing CheY-like receiver domain and AraC-type DNA-binding domain